MPRKTEWNSIFESFLYWYRFSPLFAYRIIFIKELVYIAFKANVLATIAQQITEVWGSRLNLLDPISTYVFICSKNTGYFFFFVEIINCVIITINFSLCNLSWMTGIHLVRAICYFIFLSVLFFLTLAWNIFMWIVEILLCIDHVIYYQSEKDVLFISPEMGFIASVINPSFRSRV